MRTIKLCFGAGNGVDTACLMTAVSIVTGAESPTDSPSCVCPILRAFIVKCNDNMPDALRSELFTPLIWELPGTQTTVENQILRAKVFAHGSQILAARAAAARAAAYAAAAVDADVAAAAARAARAAVDAADVAAAADAADVAAAAADVAAYAARAAAYAADVAAAYAAVREIYEYCVTLIRVAMSIGDKRPVEIVKTPEQLALQLNR
jgi:hypothetical protein